ncbi:unnamed protein product [Cuscuta epithymum]|uniref:RNase H type-1 domain-containing protein n=1 Tax=Cuscuta epithymum TaxID=186058 RepID=A0AAV0CIT6_9ASTE|nr:unnamed protein product [Cuscuta epithymum]
MDRLDFYVELEITPQNQKKKFWQVCCGLLPTRLNLRNRKVDCVVACGLCDNEEESLFHLFIDCPVAKEAWKGVDWVWSQNSARDFYSQLQVEFKSRQNDDLRKLVWGCWGLWTERNVRVWQGVCMEPKFILLKTKIYFAGWEQAQKAAAVQVNQGSTNSSLWRRPHQRRVKLNVDAAVRDYHCGLGWILRNEAGDFIAGAAKTWQGKLSPWEAELVGIREALSWVKEQGWERVDVESDASRAIAEIKNGSCISTAGVIADDVRDLCSRMTDISFCFVRRSANRAAHGFAQVACSMSGCRIWMGVPPTFIIHVLNSDLININ